MQDIPLRHGGSGSPQQLWMAAAQMSRTDGLPQQQRAALCRALTRKTLRLPDIETNPPSQRRSAPWTGWSWTHSHSQHQLHRTREHFKRCYWVSWRPCAQDEHSQAAQGCFGGSQQCCRRREEWQRFRRRKRHAARLLGHGMAEPSMQVSTDRVSYSLQLATLQTSSKLCASAASAAMA